MTDTEETRKITTGSIGFLWPMVRRRWGLTALTFASTGCVAATTAAYAALVGPALEAVHVGSRGTGAIDLGLRALAESFGELSPALLVGAALVATSLARAVASYAQAQFATRMQQHVARDLRQTLFDHLLVAKPVALLGLPTGELSSRASADVQRSESLVSLGLVPMVEHSAAIVALSLLAFYLDWKLALMAWAVLAVAFVPATLALRRSRQAHRRALDTQGNLVTQLTSLLLAAPLVRSYEAEGASRAAFETGANRLFSRAVRARALSAAVGPGIGVGAAVAVAAGLALVARRPEVPLEQVATLFAVLFLLFRQVQALAMMVGGLGASLAALSRVRELLALPVDPGDRADAIVIEPMSRRLELCDVDFAYARQPVFQGLSLSIRAGERIALAGPNGSGKTTLLRLIAGLLEPDSGSVQIDGVDVALATRASLRANFAWLPQPPWLLPDTLARNVALGAEPDPARLREAARASGAQAVIDALPEGQDTLLVEAGADLSLGQRQRLCLARALYRRAPILLLDEPTAGLDEDGAEALRATLRELPKGRTLILASHDERTIACADRTLFLEGGRVRAAPRGG